MAMQIINLISEVFKKERNTMDMWVKAYEITVVSASSGILEFCTDTLSIDGLKKKMSTFKTLNDIYRTVFSNNFAEA
jgi:phosphatidylinositol 4-kinase